MAMAKLGWLVRQAAAQPPFSHARRQPLTASSPFLAHDGDGNRRRWRREEAGSKGKRVPTVAGEDVAAAAVRDPTIAGDAAAAATRGIRLLLETQWRERERERGGGEGKWGPSK